MSLTRRRGPVLARRVREGVIALSCMTALCACECSGGPTVPMQADGTPPPWHVTDSEPPSHPKMAWIPSGVLVAGTPSGQLPRMADREMPGVSVQLGGFYIDRYNYPDEPGALPVTGLGFAEAKKICTGHGKRLCTELEWERACKGPDNLTYEYGDSYDPSACGTGPTDSLAPNGIHDRCVSGFGVHDLHGSAANWTSSPWGRGVRGKAMSVRGGSGHDGELTARCANAHPAKPLKAPTTVGVRCCAGEENLPQVELTIDAGEVLIWLGENTERDDRFLALLPSPVRHQLKNRLTALPFRISRNWEWRPMANERLLVAGGCGKLPQHDVCGVMVVRPEGERLRLLLFVSSDWWQPSVGKASSPRVLSLYGGDRNGAFRKSVVYRWGRIVEGAKHRKRGGAYVALP